MLTGLLARGVLRSSSRIRFLVAGDEWIGVPVDLTGSGLERSVVDRARAVIENNHRPAKVDGYFYELSGCVLRCGVCGRAMQGYRRAKASGGHNHYYRCRSSVGADACTNRKSHRAEVLEHDAAYLFEMNASRGALVELFDKAVAEREGVKGLRGTLERRAALTERLGVLTKMRRSFQEQQAEELMTLAELRERLAELDEDKAAISDDLRIAEDEAAAARQLEIAREHLVTAEWFDDPDAIQPHEFLTLGATPEEIRRAYNRFGTRFTVDEEGVLGMTLSLDLEGVEKSLQEKRTF